MNNAWLFKIAGAFIALVCAVCIVSSVQAAPAAPLDITLTQPDGSSFIARQWGDEWLNGFETKEGYTILLGEDGWWEYAGLGTDGTLVTSSNSVERRIVGEADVHDLPKHLRPNRKVDQSQSVSIVPGNRPLNIGTQKVLVLFVSFLDRTGSTNLNHEYFGESNSVADYYRDASFGALNLVPAEEVPPLVNDGMVSCQLYYNHPNTGATISTVNQQIVKDCIAQSNATVNYAIFDTNGDGYISSNELHLLVVVAGYEYSFDGGLKTPSIWAHHWSLNGVGLATADGVILGDAAHGGGYSQFGEIHYEWHATIGVMVHELGHDLGWPDLYDIDNTSAGVGDWSVMGSGNWNRAGAYWGDSPALPDAWLKWYQGWIAPTPVIGTVNGLQVAQAETSPSSYLVGWNPASVDWDFNNKSGTGEYFLVENRQLTGYDAGLPGCGLLIWHIDESVTYNNLANADETHPLVKLMEADGLNHLVSYVNLGDTGDPFPGASNKRSFTYNSTPNSRFYNGTDSLSSVTNISAGCSSTMTADLSYTGFSDLRFVYIPMVRRQEFIPYDAIRNGAFELGRNGDWIETSTTGRQIIKQTFTYPITPHSGTWAAELGGGNETAQLTQVTGEIQNLRFLHFWFQSYSNDYCGRDFFRIKLNGVLWDTINLCATNNRTTWNHVIIDLFFYMSPTMTIQFEVTTDGTYNSYVYIDDVTITATTSAAPQGVDPK